MGAAVTLTAFILFKVSIFGVFGQCPKNTNDGFDTCLNHIFLSLLSCPPSYLSNHTQFSIPFNQTLQNELVNVTANVTDYNSSYTPYTHIACMAKFKYIVPSIYYLGCTESPLQTTNVTVNWTTSNNVTVYLFSNQVNESINYECAFQDIDIKGDYPLQVNMSLSQYNKTQNNNMFQMGDINITVNVSDMSLYNWTTSLYDYDYGSGEDPYETNLSYQYRFFFYDNDTMVSTIVNQSNESMFLVSHTFIEERNYSIVMEAICTNITNGSKTFYYGETNTTFVVYEPIKNTTMNFKNHVGSNVSVEVMASGSVPINVSWSVLHIGNKTNDTYSCSVNTITLPKKRDNGTFNCTFTKPGTYKFTVVFSNSVSNKNDIFTFTIRSPSNKTTVITTSTTVVIVILLIVLVVIAIIFVSGYISYHKLKQRSTETANFTFIDLHKPSRYQQLKINVMNIKDKIAKRSQHRLGLVQAKDGEVSDTESFYGSLTHFEGHESL